MPTVLLWDWGVSQVRMTRSPQAEPCPTLPWAPPLCSQVWSVKPANPREVFGSPDLGTGVRTKGSSGGLASPQPRTWPKTPADK